MKPALLRTVLLFCFLIFFPGLLSAASITLKWDASETPSINGYRIYYGTQSGSYPIVIDAGPVLSATVDGLEEGGFYCFVATAYDEDGNESGYSNEVCSGELGLFPPTLTITLILSKNGEVLYEKNSDSNGIADFDGDSRHSANRKF